MAQPLPAALPPAGRGGAADARGVAGDRGRRPGRRTPPHGRRRPTTATGPLASLRRRSRRRDARHPRGARATASRVDRAGAALPRPAAARRRPRTRSSTRGSGPACWSPRRPRPSATSPRTPSGCGSRAAPSACWAPARRWARSAAAALGRDRRGRRPARRRPSGSACSAPRASAAAGCSSRSRPAPRRDAGVDLLAEVPEAADWLAGLDGRLVVGNYLYADGGTHVRVSLAADALASRRHRGPAGHRARVPGHADRRLRGARRGGRALGPRVRRAVRRGEAASAVRCAGSHAAGCCTGSTRPAPTPASPTAWCRSRAPTTRWPSGSSAGGPRTARRDGQQVSFHVAPSTRTRSVRQEPRAGRGLRRRAPLRRRGLRPLHVQHPDGRAARARPGRPSARRTPIPGRTRRTPRCTAASGARRTSPAAPSGWPRCSASATRAARPRAPSRSTGRAPARGDATAPSQPRPSATPCTKRWLTPHTRTVCCWASASKGQLASSSASSSSRGS